MADKMWAVYAQDGTLVDADFSEVYIKAKWNQGRYMVRQVVVLPVDEYEALLNNQPAGVRG